MTGRSDKPVMTKVASSNVEAIGHHGGRNELHVAYKGGGHYIYHGAGLHLAEGAIKATSPGTFIGQHVKGKFKHTKLDAA